MKRRFVSTVLAAVVAAGVASTSRAASAQELQVTGPLKGAPAVRGLRLHREGRFELAPTMSFTLLDQYRRTILFGARLNYNITDWIAVGVWGAFGAISTSTYMTDQIDSVAPRDALTATNVNHTGTYPNFGKAPFADQVAKMQYVAAAQATFTPFRGKLAIFNKIFVDTDFYASAGGALVGIQERADCGGGAGQPSCADPNSFQLASKTKVAPTFALGFTFFPGDWWSLGIEYRALPFSWNRGGFDSRGAGTNGNFPDQKIDSQDDTFDFNQMVTISVGFFFPTKPRISE